MKKNIYFLNLLLFVFLIIIVSMIGSSYITAGNIEPLKIGYSVPFKLISNEKMQYAKKVGIDYVEIGDLEVLIDKNLNFVYNNHELVEIFNDVKNIIDSAGIKVWSIHMPGVSYTDISSYDENARLSVVNMHLKLLDFLVILKPEIILFHASHLVPPNEREFRKQQAVKSANTLNVKVRQMNATMVIENGGANTTVINGMTASTMPRTVDEILEFMNRLPFSIGFAVDMNHISEPHKLVLALRDRLKTVHISDGDGSTRCFHYFPCSGEGENDWIKILASLNEVNYRGPFMYECHYGDEKDLVECYRFLFYKYQKRLRNLK